MEYKNGGRWVLCLNMWLVPKKMPLDPSLSQGKLNEARDQALGFVKILSHGASKLRLVWFSPSGEEVESHSLTLR